MKKNIIGFIAILLTTTSVFARVAPQYQRIRLIDAAVEEMAIGYLKLDSADEAQVSAIAIQGPDLVLVAVKNDICAVNVKAKIVPGLVGEPQLIATIANPEAVCGKLPKDASEIKTASYEKISAKLDRAASLGKIVKELEVTSKGSIKLVYEK